MEAANPRKKTKTPSAIACELFLPDTLNINVSLSSGRVSTFFFEAGEIKLYLALQETPLDSHRWPLTSYEGVDRFALSDPRFGSWALSLGLGVWVWGFGVCGLGFEFRGFGFMV